MARSSAQIQADPGVAQARKTSPHFKRLLRGGGHAHQTGGSIREAHHKGHRIVITTKYEVKIDGKIFNGDLSVANTGQVHYHAVPTVGFASALDLMKCVIDVFPDDFATKSPGEGNATHGEHTAHVAPVAHAPHRSSKKRLRGK